MSVRSDLPEERDSRIEEHVERYCPTMVEEVAQQLVERLHLDPNP